MDLYMTDTGDIALSSGGDLATTQTEWRNYVQQAYLRLMTSTMDFSLYPTLGADLEQLIGMPQTKATGDFGIQLIKNALTKDSSILASLPIDVKAVPISHQVIRFDVYLTAGATTEMILSIEQNLGIV